MFLKEFNFSIEMQRMKRKYNNGLMYYGLQGEERVAYQLSKLGDSVICLYNVRMFIEKEKAQIDFVVVSHNCVFIIEVKNLLGNLYINKQYEFERTIYKNGVLTKASMDNPLIQIKNQEKIIKKFLCLNNYKKEVISFLVMANDKMLIKNESDNTNIIKYDYLVPRIKIYIDNKSLEIEDLELGDKILEYDKQYNYYMLSIIKDNIKNQYTPKFSNPIDLELYIKILEIRKRISRNNNVPVCNLFNNSDAELLVIYKPKSKEEFVKIKGFKEKRYEMFGEEIIKIFKNHI